MSLQKQKPKPHAILADLLPTKILPDCRCEDAVMLQAILYLKINGYYLEHLDGEWSVQSCHHYHGCRYDFRTKYRKRLIDVLIEAVPECNRVKEKACDS